MPLTDIAIRSAKAGATVTKLSDGGGLQLWIMPTGTKLWRMAYRFDGKQKKLSIGPYPDIDLKGARAKRDSAKAQLRDGIDPSADKRLQELTAATSRANAFEIVAAELMTKKEREGRAAATMEKARWLAELLAIIVEEGCNLDRTGMTGQQVAATNRIDVLAVLARDIAERLSEGVFGIVKAA